MSHSKKPSFLLFFAVWGAVAVAAQADPLASNFLVGLRSPAPGILWSWSAEGEPAASQVELQNDRGKLRTVQISTTSPYEFAPAVPGFPRHLQDARLAGAASAVVNGTLFLPAYQAWRGGLPELVGFYRQSKTSSREADFLELHFGGDGLSEKDLVAARTLAACGDSLWVSLGSAGLGLLAQPTQTGWKMQQIAVDGGAKKWSVERSCGGERECLWSAGQAVQSVECKEGGRFPQIEVGQKRFQLLQDGVLQAVDGQPQLAAGELLMGEWECGDGRWLQSVRNSPSGVASRLWWRTTEKGWRQIDSAAWDSTGLLIHRLVCLDGVGWGAFHSLESYRNGLLKLEKGGWELFEIPGQRAVVSDLQLMPGRDGENWLVAATYGMGLALSADSGKSWSSVMNQTAIKGDLREIRAIPSLIQRNGVVSRIAYRLSERSSVTIELFSYDMRLVKRIVKGESRPADSQRSSDSDRDFWDGTDDNGRYVSSGVYYVRVVDDRGHEGWSKIYKSAGADR